MLRTLYLAALAMALIFGGAARADVADKYKEVSADLVKAGDYAQIQDDADGAKRLYEQALAANPKNVDAFFALAKLHEAEGRVGTGLKYYRLTLSLEPNHLSALERQALAFLKKDSLEKAEKNLAKLKRLCQTDGCTELESVETAILDHRRTALNETSVTITDTEAQN
ncbi:MAG: tetratricopeptide repeat protein [Sphingomonadales bacterium]|nr:tetratricopeptide repeat protein [Sphingomonadales bacterium]